MKRLLLMLTIAASALAQPKNVKVLTDVPREGIIPIMTVMANSLGVTCLHCHEEAWASDAKPAKEIGRRMIRLTRAINDTHYGGKVVVTCNTCHRGRLLTVDTPLVADAGYLRAAETRVVQPVLPAPKDLLDAYRRTTVPATITNRLSKGIATVVSGRAGPRSAPFELYQERPSKAELTMSLPYPPEGSLELRSHFFRQLSYPDAKTIRADRVRNRDAWVVEVAPGERLYLDAVTGVLLRREREVPTLVGPLPEQYDFDDYRTVDGALVPFLLQWSRGDYQVTHRFAEVRQNVTRE